MRVFSALDLSGACKEELDTVLSPLKDTYPRFRWAQNKNLHITIAFMGEISQTDLPLLDEAMKQAAEQSCSFTYTITRFLFFPSVHRAHVLALGIGDGSDAICSIADCLENNLAVIGGLRPREKRTFIPHISAARKGREPIKVHRDHIPLLNLSCSAEGLSLFSSDLYPSGPVYKVLSFYPFSASGA